MKSLRLTGFHLKRILTKNWAYLIFTFAMPLFIVLAFLFIMDSDESLMSSPDHVVVNQSEYVDEHIKPQLSEKYQSYFIEDEEEAFKQLDQIEVSMVYVIPTGFPITTQQISVHSLNGENQDMIFESEFLTILTESMRQDAYQEADIIYETVLVDEVEVQIAEEMIHSNLAFTLFMVLFFLGYSTGFIASDLALMRKDGLLTRSLISNTYSAQILGSVLGAYAIYNVLSSILIIYISSTLFNYPISNLLLVLSLIVSVTIFIAGLTMFLFRLIKNDKLVQFIGILLAIILVFIPTFLQSTDQFSFVQYLSPYYWVFDSLDTGQVFPNVFFIILYGLVLFTAGSFKIERLVKSR